MLRCSGLFPVLAPLTLLALLASRAEAGPGGFVYALQQVNGGANQIHGFRFDETTGTLRPIPGFPVSSGGNGTGSVVSEQLIYREGRLFVLNDGSNTVTAFTVNAATGALSAMPYNPIALGAGNWWCMDVHPSGSPVVVGNSSTPQLASFVVTASTATAAAGSPYSMGTASPFGCRFSQNGSFIYSGGSASTTFAGFSVNQGTGVLTALAGSPFSSGANFPIAFATDSAGRIFAANFPVTQVRAFTTTAGVPSAVTGNPFASGVTDVVHGVAHPAGFYMVADRAANRIGVYQIAGSGSATTLTAVSGSPFASGGTFTAALAVSPSGAHLLAAHGNSRNLTVFSVNQATGALASSSVQPINTLGSSGVISGLAFAPDEAGFIYVLNQSNGGANQLYGYRIHEGTGALTALPGFPMATGGNGTGAATAEAMAYRNGRLFVLNDGTDSMSVFKVNRTTGALTAVSYSPVALGAGKNLGCVAIHPNGLWAVVGYATGGVESVLVAPTTAVFAAGSPYESFGPISYSCAFSQDGNYFYTGGNLGTAFEGYSVNPDNGVLTRLPGSPFETGGTAAFGAYATDSSGRLFAALLQSSSQLRVFTTAAGVPSDVSGNPFSGLGMDQPVFGLLHPAGFYFTAARNSNNVGSFQISGSGAATTLIQAAGSPFGTGGGVSATALALTPNGRFLVAANGLSRNLTVFQVHQGTGVLSFLGLQANNTLGATGRLSGMALAPPVPPFVDDPVIAASTVVQAIHINDLRSRVDGLRAQYGVPPYVYTDPTLTAASTLVRAIHLQELRAAVAEVYLELGMAMPSYSEFITAGVTVKAAHINELRAAIMAIE